MNALSLQGKIYVVCQAVYFIMILYGLYELRQARKAIEKISVEKECQTKRK